jgi:hypothetical protein
MNLHDAKKLVGTAALASFLMSNPLRSLAADFTSRDYRVGQQPAAVLVYDYNGDELGRYKQQHGSGLG